MGLSEDQSSCSTKKPSKNTVMVTENDCIDTDDAPNTKAHRSSPKKKDFNRSQHHFHHRENRRKLLGVRHLRRLENLSILLSQAEADEDDSGEVDFVDLVSHQNSAFRELFMEPEKMSTWVAFANSSEEEQENILASADKVKLRDIFEVLDDANDFVNIDDSTANQSINFAVSAHQCFQRINRNLRAFLRRSGFPVGELHHLEEELVAFFQEWPSSVYIAHMPNGYRRMMLHAVSQYLDLDARSIDVPGSSAQRQTQVENNRNEGNIFLPPPTPLATYISSNKTVIASQT